MANVQIKQFEDTAGNPITGLTPEHAVYGSDGVRLDAKLLEIQSQAAQVAVNTEKIAELESTIQSNPPELFVKREEVSGVIGLTEDDLAVRTMAHGYTKDEVWYRSNHFRELLNDSGVYDTFLFYSDPHMMFTGNSVMDYNLDAPILKKFSLIQKYAKTNPFSFVLDGGDWLNHTNPAANATQMLAWLAGTMPSIFPNYKFMLGNHDTNYQGVSTLSQGALNGILFNRYGGKSYYTFKTGVSRVYIFDTGVDDDDTMSAYRWEQIDWFANQLIANDDPYTIICGHIYRNAWAQNVASAFVQNVMTIVAAYNEKRTAALNGHTYNFGTKAGRVWAYFAGHRHSDYDIVDPIGGIPVVGVAKSMTLTDPNYKTTFDMIKVGYGEGKIRCIRVGEGEDRVIDIPAPATWQTIAPASTSNGWYLIGEYRCNQSAGDKLVKYQVTPGELLRITLAADTNGYVACQFQKIASVSSGDASSQGGKAMYLKSTWVSGIYEVPDDCYYLIVCSSVNNTTDTVERIVK